MKTEMGSTVLENKSRDKLIMSHCYGSNRKWEMFVLPLSLVVEAVVVVTVTLVAETVALVAVEKH